MALITCPECGKEISDMAKACPHCGAPAPLKSAKSERMEKTVKLALKLILIIVTVAVIVGCVIWSDLKAEQRQEEEFMNSDSYKEMQGYMDKIDEANEKTDEISERITERYEKFGEAPEK